MKRIVLPLLFTFLVTLTFGQDLKKANNYLKDKKYEKAKTEVDGLLAKDPKNSEALYLKSKIYVIMADSATYNNLFTGDPYTQSFEAFKTAIADSNNPKIALAIIQDNYQPVFSVYSGIYRDAAKDFNEAAGGKSDTVGFAKAMNRFIEADKVGQYINDNKWANLGKVDTNLVLNIARSALNAKNNEMARKYLLELADAHIRGLKDSADESFRLPYQWLTLDYKEAGDSANMVKYATLGKQLFPDDDYYDFVLMDFYREHEDRPDLFKKYDELTAKHPDSLRYHLNYATEIFSYLYNSDEGTVINDKENLLNTLRTNLEKATTIDPNNASVNLLHAQYYYNLGIVNLENAGKIKGAKLTPEQQKQKTDLTENGKNSLKQAIPFAEKVASALEADYKKSDRSRYKSSINLLENIYQSLGDKDALKKYQDIYDQADAKFVN